MLPNALIIILLGLTPPVETSVQDTIGTVDAHTVSVYAEPCNEACFTGVPSTTTTTVDELMVNGSAMLIRRAAMAGEAMVGGLRGGQVALTIDGMKVHSACIDKMDPATAYVELDNLNVLELTQGSGDLRYGANLGGALTFRTEQPEVGAPLQGSAALWYDVNGNARTLKVNGGGSTDVTALRAGYTYRAANDYRAGGGLTVAGSRFEKHNASAAGTITLDSNQWLDVAGIYDLATFIGYPALLMDTRRAEAIIGGVTWRSEWTSNLTSSVKLYANVVDHVMDDLDRSVDEVSNRPFMPAMWMPMYGTTQTTGALGEARWNSSSTLVTAVLDLSLLQATATMDMIPLDTTVSSMTMVNIGDALVGTIGINGVIEHQLSARSSLRGSVRLDVSPRTLNNESSRQILGAYQPGAPLDRTLSTLSASFRMMHSITENASVDLGLSSLGRLPTHLESYGFWLYDPQSNFVVNGNPGLAAERSWGAEVGADLRTDDARFRLAARGQRITAYIATVPAASEESVPLRRYANVGDAVLVSADLSWQFPVLSSVVVGGMATWTYGQAVDLRDPLPFIAPLSGLLRAVWSIDDIQIEGRLRGALPQTRVSQQLQPENTTPSWIVADLSAVWTISRTIAVTAHLRNLFDVRYHEHTSINDLLSPGRSIMIQVRSSW